MPLFVTVTPGTTVTSSTTLDASTLNLLGTPSVDVTGTVDGGSVSITNGSVQLAALVAQANATIVGNGSGSSNSPVALDASADFAFTPTTFLIKAAAVTTAKIADANVTYAKIQNVADARLLGRSQGAAGVVQELTVGSNLTLSTGVLNALRPGVVFTNVLTTAVYTLPIVRGSAIEITQLTTSITPQTATSKVLVQFNISCETQVRAAFILERVIGAAVEELGVPTSAGTRINGIRVQPWDGNNDFSQLIVPICFVDSPASTAAVTYRIKVYGDGAYTFGLNRSITDTDNTNYTRATSQVILQEILP